MSEAKAATTRHFTTRRGFIAAAGFGVVSLYLLWAVYGAAPLGVGPHQEAAMPPEGGHGGEHGSAPSGPSSEEFRREVNRFVESNRIEDGSVRPRRPAPGRAEAPSEHAGHDMASENTASEPLDVYLMAFQWGFTPSVLRLEAGVRYRFRMMAVDVAHGASLRLGPASRIVRLRPGVPVEQEITFTRPGEYLLYCTVYCGLPHDRMQGRIVVTEPGA